LCHDKVAAQDLQLGERHVGERQVPVNDDHRLDGRRKCCGARVSLAGQSAEHWQETRIQQTPKHRLAESLLLRPHLLLAPNDGKPRNRALAAKDQHPIELIISC
jgi:hypothetical protein